MLFFFIGGVENEHSNNMFVAPAVIRVADPFLVMVQIYESQVVSWLLGKPAIVRTKVVFNIYFNIRGVNIQDIEQARREVPSKGV